MATITISATDVTNAENFLTAYLSGKIPNADFSPGSAERDLVINAIAYIYAFFQAENTTAANNASLQSLSQMVDTTEVDSSVDAVLSNWFLTRKTGTNATIPVTLHFSRAADATVLPSTTFNYNTTLAYNIGQATPLAISASQMLPEINVDGTVADYVVTITLTATGVGAEYNVPPATFSSVDPFSPYFLYAASVAQAQDGVSTEATAALLNRAPTAISVRSLVNQRSISTVLLDMFSELTSVQTIGFGDPEMQRDQADETVTRLNMHLGGYTDIYVGLPRTSVTDSGIVGAAYARPDGLINILSDGTTDFIAAGVSAGDVLNVTVGVSNAPVQYIISNLDQHHLYVQDSTPFVTATDEASPPTFVTYTVGNISPGFNNKVASTGTGQTSRTLTTANSVLLTGQPHYQINKVTVTSPSNVVTVLGTRINSGTPVAGQYLVTALEPGNAQSAKAVDLITVASTYTGYTLQATYETLVGYSNIQTYVTDGFQRVLCSNALTKGLHPVYIDLILSFRLKNQASPATIDVTAVEASIATFISNFSTSGDTDNIDISAITQFMRDTYGNIGYVFSPVNLTYNLYAPDGQVYSFATNDEITIEPAYPDNSAKLTNGLALRSPIANASIDPSVSATNAALFAAANAQLAEQLLLLGVSDRTIRYCCDSTNVSLNLV